jgi:hypothetical protein
MPVKLASQIPSTPAGVPAISRGRSVSPRQIGKTSKKTLQIAVNLWIARFVFRFLLRGIAKHEISVTGRLFSGFSLSFSSLIFA